MRGKAKNAAIRALALALCLSLACILAACQTEVELPEGLESHNTNSAAAVYYLNPVPEQDARWQELAARYTQETGVPVTVLSPEEGSYETVLAAEMTKIESPTLFSVSGMEDLTAWEDYIWDLADSELYADLGLPMLALERGGAVLAVPYSASAYGLLVDDGLLKLAGLSAESINGLLALQSVAGELVTRQEELGHGAFASMGLRGAADAENGAALLAGVAANAEDFKAAWDVYTISGLHVISELAELSADQGVKDFNAGSAVFYLTGSWEYADIRAAKPLAELAVIPIYTGGSGDANRGFPVKAGDYWWINKDADLKDIEATLAFMQWCVSSETGTAAMEAMGYFPPYRSSPLDNLFISAAVAAADKGRTITVYDDPQPENWSGINTALAAYAAEEIENVSFGDWEPVTAAFRGS